MYMGFTRGSVVKNRPAKAGDSSSIPGSGRSPGEGNGNLLQYSCLENPMDRGAWWATVHGVAGVRHDWGTMHQQGAYTDYFSFFVCVCPIVPVPFVLKLSFLHWIAFVSLSEISCYILGSLFSFIDLSACSFICIRWFVSFTLPFHINFKNQ